MLGAVLGTGVTTDAQPCVLSVLGTSQRLGDKLNKQRTYAACVTLWQGTDLARWGSRVQILRLPIPVALFMLCRWNSSSKVNILFHGLRLLLKYFEYSHLTTIRSNTLGCRQSQTIWRKIEEENH